MTIQSLPPQYKRGYVLGSNGTITDPKDFIDAKIPQLHALLTVMAGLVTEYNTDIQYELLMLAEGVARDLHEALEENNTESISAWEKRNALQKHESQFHK